MAPRLDLATGHRHGYQRRDHRSKNNDRLSPHDASFRHCTLRNRISPLVGINAAFCIATLTCVNTTIALAGTGNTHSTSAVPVVIPVRTGRTRRTTTADTTAPSDNVRITTGVSDAANTATHPLRPTTATSTIADRRNR
jgi:hypothetical protein